MDTKSRGRLNFIRTLKGRFSNEIKDLQNTIALRKEQVRDKSYSSCRQEYEEISRMVDELYTLKRKMACLEQKELGLIEMVSKDEDEAFIEDYVAGFEYCTTAEEKAHLENVLRASLFWGRTH